MFFIFDILFKAWLVLWLGFIAYAAIAHKPAQAATFILIGLVFGIFLLRVRGHYKTLRLGSKIRKNPNNKTVKEYISYIAKRTIENNPVTWGSLRETYRQIAERPDIDYELKVKLYETLKLKGTRGIYYPQKQLNLTPEQVEEKKRHAGEAGEKQVAYALQWLDGERFKVYHNVKLRSGPDTQEFDAIVVGDNAVFNIEVKNYVGNLTIDDDGNWYRVVGGRMTGTENPLFQVKRHHKVLQSVIKIEVPIVDLIVWANVESVIEGAHNSPVKVLKSDRLTYFIENYDEGLEITRDERAFIERTIAANARGYTGKHA